VLAAGFMTMLDVSNVNVALPSIQQSLHARQNRRYLPAPTGTRFAGPGPSLVDLCGSSGGTTTMSPGPALTCSSPAWKVRLPPTTTHVSSYDMVREQYAESVRAGQAAGVIRADIDPDLKSLEVIAFLNGLETSWLMNPSIPVEDVAEAWAKSQRADMTAD